MAIYSEQNPKQGNLVWMIGARIFFISCEFTDTIAGSEKVGTKKAVFKKSVVKLIPVITKLKNVSFSENGACVVETKLFK